MTNSNQSWQECLAENAKLRAEVAELRKQHPLNKLRDRIHRKMQDDADSQDEVHPCEVWAIALRWTDEAIVEGAGLRLVAFSESKLPHDEERQQAESAAAAPNHPNRPNTVTEALTQALAAAPAPAGIEVSEEGQPKTAAVKIDRSEFRIADGVKFTADDALKLLGKDIYAYGVWCRDPRDGDHFCEGWRELSQFCTYFTAPKIINAGTGEPIVLLPAGAKPEAPQADAELQRLVDAFRKDHCVGGELTMSWSRLLDALARKAGAR